MGEVKSGLSQTAKEVAKLEADFQRKMGGDFVRTLQNGQKSVRELGVDFLQTARNAGIGGAQIESAAGSMGVFSRTQMAAAKSSADLAIETDRLIHQMQNGEITAAQAGEQFGKLAANAQSGGVNINQMAAKFAAAAAVIGVAAMAVNAVFDFARQGAELDYASVKFERLAENAGSLSSVLLGDLRTATRGLYSDAELMGSAGDFMALGLAKTHDEAVRLAAVSGALNMNMNQLVLTLTNQTTMRFDALGVSVDGFKERVDELKEAGLSAEEAFSEAFLQQAEAQIEKVGHAADTTLGSFMRLSAQGANAWDRLKIAAGKALAPIADALADDLEKTNRLNYAVDILGATFTLVQVQGKGMVQMYRTMGGELLDYEELIKRAMEVERLNNFELERAVFLHAQLNPEIKDTANEYGELAESIEEAEQRIRDFYSAAQGNPLNDILGAADASEFYRLGGDYVAAYVEGVRTQIANAGGDIGGVLAQPFETASLQAAAFQVALGEINVSQAMAELNKLPVPIDDARAKLNDFIALMNAEDGKKASVYLDVKTNIPFGLLQSLLGLTRGQTADALRYTAQGHATGGYLGERGPLVKLGERGWEYGRYDARKGAWEIIPHEKSVAMERDGYGAQAGMMAGGLLFDTWHPPEGARQSRVGAAAKANSVGAAAKANSVGAAAKANSVGAAANIASVAADAAVRAATASAVGVGAAVGGQGQAFAAQIVEEMAQQNLRASAQLNAELREGFGRVVAQLQQLARPGHIKNAMLEVIAEVR